MARSFSLSRRDATAGSLFSFARMLGWLDVGRQRRALLRLDDHLLRDINVPRHLAADEAGRPFWDVPETWKR